MTGRGECLDRCFGSVAPHIVKPVWICIAPKTELERVLAPENIVSFKQRSRYLIMKEMFHWWQPPNKGTGPIELHIGFDG